MIILQITKTEKNENYGLQLKEWESSEYRQRGMYDERNIPTPDKTGTILQTAITEEQFEAIRKAILEKF